MKRTRNQIAKDIYNACGGDFIDCNNNIAEKQNALINAIAWIECEPKDGWYNIARRQIEALRKIQFEDADDETFFIDLITALPQENPKDLVDVINDSYNSKKSWDVDYINEYIAKYVA